MRVDVVTRPRKPKTALDAARISGTNTPIANVYEEEGGVRLRVDAGLEFSASDLTLVVEDQTAKVLASEEVIVEATIDPDLTTPPTVTTSDRGVLEAWFPRKK